MINLLAIKKNKDNLKKLSEKEIQSKLYGEFVDKHNEISVTTQKPVTVVKPHVEKPQIEINELTSQAGDLFSSVMVPKKETKKEIEDLAGSELPVRKNEIPSRPVQSEIKKSHSSFNTTHTARSYQKSEKKRNDFRIWQSLWAAVKVVFAALGSGLLSSLRSGTGFFKNIGEYLYLRRKSVKKIATWVLSVFVLVGLFVAVNNLNVKREKALREAPRKDIKKQTALVQTTKQKLPETAVTAQTNAAADSLAREGEPLSTPETESKPIPQQEKQATHGDFVVQLATYMSQSDADRMVGTLNQNQYPGFVKGFTRTGGKVYYSVFIGRFKTYQEAQESFARFRKTEIAKPFQDAFIRSLKE